MVRHITLLALADLLAKNGHGELCVRGWLHALSRRGSSGGILKTMEDMEGQSACLP